MAKNEKPLAGGNKESLGDLKLSVDENQLEQLVHEFNLCLTEIVGNDKSNPIRHEYEKLYKALKKSREAEKRLMNKCRDLHAELLITANKTATFADDHNTLANLQKENKRAWEIIDELKRKDLTNTEKIQDGRAEIARLTKLLESTGGLDLGDTKFSFKELTNIKENLELQLDDEHKLVAQVREQLAKAEELAKQLDDEKQDANGKMLNATYETAGMRAELQREIRRRERLEIELRKTKQDLDIKTEEVTRLASQCDKAQQELQQNDVQLKEQRIIADRSQKEVDSMQDQLIRAQDEYEKAASRAAKATDELQELRTLYKQQEEEITALRMEIVKGNRQRDTIQRKLHLIEEAKRETDEQRDMMQAELTAAEKTVDNMKKAAENDRKLLAQAQRERDMFDANCRKAAGEVSKQSSLAKQSEQAVRNLDTEIANYRGEAQKQRQIIYQLEKDRDRYINESAELTQKLLHQIEEVKIRETEIFDLKKKFVECETRLKQQQNLYEAVRSDRNLYSKNLMESQDEITETRRKLTISHHTINQLREEISTAEGNLAREHLDKRNIVAERDMLSGELTKIREQLAEMKSYINRQQLEGTKLLKIIRESDALATRQRKELDIVIAERDVLGTQLIRRNDELTLLYEKIRIQQSVLDKGEKGYKQRVEDIRVLKIEIRRLRRELNKAHAISKMSSEMRNDYYHLQRSLLRERAKCKALEEELSRPMNMHRWRKLEGSDPSLFEMIKKTQYLQRRLVRKMTQLAHAHNTIQEKDRLYLELKRILARQPGLEIVEKVSTYQTALRHRARQMMAMAGELNMFESRANDTRYEADRVADELKQIKRKYFVEKRRGQAAMEAMSAMKHTTTSMAVIAEDKTLLSTMGTMTAAATPGAAALRRRVLPSLIAKPRAERYAGGGFSLTRPKGMRTNTPSKFGHLDDYNNKQL